MPTLESARKFVEQHHGKAVARKATDGFLKVHGCEGHELDEIPAAIRTLPMILSVAADKRITPELVPAAHGPRRRQARIEEAQSAFARGSSPIVERLERQLATNVTECWLSESLKVEGPIASIEEVAEAHEVTHIGLARPLCRELTVTQHTTGASAYRSGCGLTGEGVDVGILDTEIDRRHPALAGRVEQRANYTGENWGRPHDHGTAIAGIVGSKDDVIPGLAPRANLINFKIMRDGLDFDGLDFHAALALQDAVEQGLRVVNCSWGCGLATNGSSPLCHACNRAWTFGTMAIKSAGNDGPHAKSLTMPADAEGVIVVGATDRHGLHVADYSSRGPTRKGLVRPHFVAPGGLKTDGLISCQVGGGFGVCGYGSSLAAAHVTGMLALLLQREPTLEPDELLQKLVAMAVPLAGVDANAQGRGLLVLR